MADLASCTGIDDTPHVFSIADTKPIKSTMLVENEFSWWLQRARCALIRRKDLSRQKKARHRANLKRDTALLRGKKRHPPKSRHRDKGKTHKTAGPANGQRRRRLFQESLNGKGKPKREGGGPSECELLTGCFNFFFTHLINCFLGVCLILWRTNAALSGCLVRGQLV